jgi:hypothetical protein
MEPLLHVVEREHRGLADGAGPEGAEGTEVDVDAGKVIQRLFLRLKPDLVRREAAGRVARSGSLCAKLNSTIGCCGAITGQCRSRVSA